MCHCTGDSAEVALTDRSTREFQNPIKRLFFDIFLQSIFSKNEHLHTIQGSGGYQFLPALNIVAPGSPVDVVFTMIHHPHTDANMIQSVDPDTLTNTQGGWKENLQS